MHAPRRSALGPLRKIGQQLGQQNYVIDDVFQRAASVLSEWTYDPCMGKGRQALRPLPTEVPPRAHDGAEVARVGRDTESTTLHINVSYKT